VVMLVLDLSGSIGTPPKLADLQSAATTALDALDAADGSTDQSIGGNSVGIVVYQGSGATIEAPLGSSYATLLHDIQNLPAPSGGSPHDVGINTASTALAAAPSGLAKAMVLVTDGQATGSDLTNATTAATNAKASGVDIVPVGIGSDASPDNLQAWASQASSYQAGTPGPIDGTKLVSDLGALVAVPTSFTLGEALGANFSAAAQSVSTGSVTTGPGTLQWTGSLIGNQSATLVYKATRNGNQVFSTTTELVSTASLAVAGGTATVTPPASISIDVLPCGATPIAATTCTGAACSVSGTQGGVQYSASIGSPPAGTSVSLASLNAPSPPAGVCAGFTPHTQGAELDIRPLATSASLRLVIPKSSLGSTKWFNTQVCLGTNMRFITEISSIFNLSPEAKFVAGGSVPGRWWGLLPSIPRIDYFPGHGFVIGPYITSRSVDSTGAATITFVVPFISASTGLTTDGKPGYDPKLWG
jgi:von Willebrand factor type A domain